MLGEYSDISPSLFIVVRSAVSDKGMVIRESVGSGLPSMLPTCFLGVVVFRGVELLDANSSDCGVVMGDFGASFAGVIAASAETGRGAEESITAAWTTEKRMQRSAV
jgi:hypothetical protein